MSDQLYSAEEAAAILGLQVRTVRNYVRDGRLAGVRIGKQYRIARTDLEAFAGGGISSAPEAAPQAAASRAIQVSSVIELDGAEPEDAGRVMRTLDALLAGRTGDRGALRVEPVYDEHRLRLKVIVVGDAEDALEIIRLVVAVY